MRSLKWILASSLIAVLAACGGGGAPADTTPPAKPSGVVAVPGNAQVTLNWTANSEADLNGYTIVYGTSAGSLTSTATATKTETSKVITGLTNGTTYFFAMEAADTANNKSGNTDAVQASPAAPDTTAPTVSSTVPAAGATGVALGSNIAVTFSEAMDVGQTTVSLSPALVLGDPVWSDGNRTATFDPASDLSASTGYTITVAGKDTAGNDLGGTSTFAFTTAAPADTVRPTVSSVSPAGGATGVPVGVNIQFSFSEPMSRATVEAAFTSTPAVTCAWFWSSDSTLASCDPTANFAASANITVGLGTGAADAAGNTLASAFSSSFTTAAAPDTTLPTITTVTPANDAQGVDECPEIVVNFSEPMDRVSVQTAFAVTSPTGLNAGFFTWNTAGTRVTYDPGISVCAALGATVNWRVTTVARDLAGNNMAAQFNASFRIEREFTKDIISTATLDGWANSNNQVLLAPVFIVPDGWAGDDTANVAYRTYYSFDISTTNLPANLIRIRSSTLYVNQFSVLGTPYAKLGNLVAQHVNYGPTLEVADFETAPLSATNFTLSTTASTGYKSVSVTSRVQDDYTNRAARGNRSQWRVRFLTNASLDGTADAALLGTGNTSDATKPYLRIVYRAP